MRGNSVLCRIDLALAEDLNLFSRGTGEVHMDLHPAPVRTRRVCSVDILTVLHRTLFQPPIYWTFAASDRRVCSFYPWRTLESEPAFVAFIYVNHRQCRTCMGVPSLGVNDLI